MKSEWKKDENLAGEWNYTAGKWNGDPTDKGILLRHFLALISDLWQFHLISTFMV